MTLPCRTPVLLAFALAASLSLAAPGMATAAAPADQGQDQALHHPDGQTPPKVAPRARMGGAAPKSGGPGGMMMGGDMSQMMPMMQMMKMMPMMQGMMMHGGMGSPGMMPLRHVEGVIAFTKAELRITDAQAPQWNAFADALRGAAAAPPAGPQPGMPAAAVPDTAPERMERQIDQLSKRLDTMKTMLAAAKPLYAVLSDEQRKTADALMAEHVMGMRAHGMGSR